MKRLLRLLLLCAGLLSTAAFAHSASTAYLRASVEDGAWTLDWRIALRDLDALLDLDANRDGRLTWGEVTDRARDIEALAARSLRVRHAAGACDLRIAAPRFARGDDLSFARIVAEANCAGRKGPIELEYRLFDTIDPTHRALLLTAEGAGPRALAPGSSIALDAGDAGSNAVAGSPGTPNFGELFATGVGHIAGGLDHLLFLVVLMLPAVLQRTSDGRWIARTGSTRRALVDVLWIVTAFTCAHSLTLGVATFGWVRVSPHVIEPLIAATVLFAALNNLWPVVVRRARWVAFAFGLVHGFGFAEVLAPLSLPAPELAQALLAFNLGVEAGQLAIVAVGFVLLALAARWSGYRRWVLASGSIAIAALAVVWLIDRLFGFEMGELVMGSLQ